MTDQEQKAIMTLVLMAAFADGRNDATERADVTRVAESLSQGTSLRVEDDSRRRLPRGGQRTADEDVPQCTEETTARRK